MSILSNNKCCIHKLIRFPLCNILTHLWFVNSYKKIIIIIKMYTMIIFSLDFRKKSMDFITQITIHVILSNTNLHSTLRDEKPKILYENPSCSNAACRLHGEWWQLYSGRIANPLNSFLVFASHVMQGMGGWMVCLSVKLVWCHSYNLYRCERAQRRKNWGRKNNIWDRKTNTWDRKNKFVIVKIT